MGKMSGLDPHIKELRSCAETIIGVADALAEMFASPDAEEQPEVPASEEEKSLTLEDVRHRLALVAQAGFSPQVRDLITKYGANRLSEIDPARYEALLRDADALSKREAANDG